MPDDDKNQLLKQKITERAKDERFVHHHWFVRYHIEIVARIAQELCAHYPQADRQFVDALAWLHDYEKIVDFDNEFNTELAATRSLMQEIGYSTEVIEKMAQSINRCNARDDLDKADIEVQIISSSDAASHLVGPFVALYWYENPSKSMDELQAENNRKLTVDWEKKVTLPEIKQAFALRHQYTLEIAGKLPASFLH